MSSLEEKLAQLRSLPYETVLEYAERYVKTHHTHMKAVNKDYEKHKAKRREYARLYYHRKKKEKEEKEAREAQEAAKKEQQVSMNSFQQVTRPPRLDFAVQQQITA
ncbi:hypothetical protein OAM67_01270 [bacterium]|nr:hypothetical protein [bacterium]